MSTELKTMFCRKGIIASIKETHKIITDECRDYFDRIEIRGPSLLIDYLTTYQSLPSNFNRNLFDSVKKQLVEQKSQDFTKFHIRAQHKAILNSRSKFIGAAKIMGCESAIFECNPNTKKLEDTSLIGIKPNISLAIKAFCLCSDRSKNFYGNASCTSPVKSFFKRFYGYSSPNQAFVNKTTFAIANELDMSPIDVNTAMWLIG